jgi:membrane protease YdiL (CAAX protease family)
MAVSRSLRGGLLWGPRAYEPKTPWRPGTAILAGVAIIALSIVGVVLMLGSGVVSRMPDSAQLPRGTTQLAVLGIWQVATIVLTVAASAMFGGRIVDVLALGRPAGAPLVYLKGVLLMVLLQIGVSIVQQSLFQQDMYADLRPFVQLFGEHRVLALLVVGIGAPLSEELLFRGFLLSALARSRIGFWPGALLTTGLWTALHAGYSTSGIAEVFLIGLFLSWLLWRTGSLRVPIFCHALYNSLIVLVLWYVPLPAG